MNEDFFSIVGHLAQRRHREDQLSNTFRACFVHSRSFRSTVLRQLLTVCGFPNKLADSEEWACQTQLTEVFGKQNPDVCRYDIELLNGSGGNSNIPGHFRLESKIEAPLSKSQLGRYKRRTGVQLVAITKNYPEVPIQWMRRKGIASLRWQDIHRALTAARNDTAIDKFLTGQFLSYLENSNMAFREIRLRQLEDFADLLGTIRMQQRDGRVPKIGTFTTGNDCLLMLGDLDRGIRDYLPNSDGWKTWGPGYSQTNSEKDGVWHSLGFQRYKGSRRKVELDCSLDFPDDKNEDIYWGLYLTVGKKVEREHCRPIKNYCKKGLLEREELRKEAVSLLKRWKVYK